MWDFTFFFQIQEFFESWPFLTKSRDFLCWRSLFGNVTLFRCLPSALIFFQLKCCTLATTVDHLYLLWCGAAHCWLFTYTEHQGHLSIIWISKYGKTLGKRHERCNALMIFKKFFFFFNWRIQDVFLNSNSKNSWNFVYNQVKNFFRFDLINAI